MLTTNLKIDGEKTSVQATRKDDGGWKYRVGDDMSWSEWTDKAHSRDLISMQLKYYFEKGRDLR